MKLLNTLVNFIVIHNKEIYNVKCVQIENGPRKIGILFSLLETFTHITLLPSHRELKYKQNKIVIIILLNSCSIFPHIKWCCHQLLHATQNLAKTEIWHP